MNITLITVGTLKEQYLTTAMGEYIKRLSAYAKFEEINLKEEKILDEDNEKEIAAALDAEGEKILKAVPKDAYLITLCVEGVQVSSEELAKKIETAAQKSGKICLVIGSSHGLSPKVKAASDYRMSVSKLTFPHQLMRVMILEILYRSMTILAGKRYHK
ncbi:MAG: 23S rRNA (pseudouridine(1915)-N(3))-methyltransferase RlmH [Clostridia bacterium]|nr:23S rRNA (pseudouridine(1915)-N(3))-methyltransferase RlmH [Clostridia bacterium]